MCVEKKEKVVGGVPKQTRQSCVKCGGVFSLSWEANPVVWCFTSICMFGSVVTENCESVVHMV